MALMTDVELGDRNPPQLIQNLENFIGDLKFDASFFLAGADIACSFSASATIRELVEITDKVTESKTYPLSVASVTSSPATNPKDGKFGLLLGEVRSLSRELQSQYFVLPLRQNQMTNFDDPKTNFAQQPHRDCHPHLLAKLDYSVWRTEVCNDRSWCPV